MSELTIFEKISQRLLPGFIIDEKRSLIGVITDGDIRRGLINKIDVSESVTRIMSKEFKYLRKGENWHEVIKQSEAIGLSTLPVLDDMDRIIEIRSKNRTTARKYQENTVLIMAGGKGTMSKWVSRFPRS